MRQLGEVVRLDAKPIDERLVVHQFGTQRLDRDVAVEHGVARGMNLSDAALAEQFGDLVLPNPAHAHSGLSKADNCRVGVVGLVVATRARRASLPRRGFGRARRHETRRPKHCRDRPRRAPRWIRSWQASSGAMARGDLRDLAVRRPAREARRCTGSAHRRPRAESVACDISGFTSGAVPMRLQQHIAVLAHRGFVLGHRAVAHQLAHQRLVLGELRSASRRATDRRGCRRHGRTRRRRRARPARYRSCPCRRIPDARAHARRSPCWRPRTRSPDAARTGPLWSKNTRRTTSSASALAISPAACPPMPSATSRKSSPLRLPRRQHERTRSSLCVRTRADIGQPWRRRASASIAQRPMRPHPSSRSHRPH